jgi:hypothetical protein
LTDYDKWLHCRHPNTIVFIRTDAGILTFDDDAIKVGKAISRIVKNDMLLIPENVKHLEMSHLSRLGYNVKEIIYCCV